MEDIQGGFECEFVEKPPKAVQSECPVCLLVLREPYQATCCGYSFCRVCIERIKIRNIPCPCCKAEEFEHFENKRLKRSIYEFKVKCIHETQGCQWVGELGQLDNHLNSNPTKEKQLEGCKLTRIQCIHCSELLQRYDIPVHQLDQCQRRPFSCDYCKEFDSNYKDVTANHWPVCGKHPLPCPNKCGETFQRQNIENHTVKDCPLAVVDCDFQHVGCEVRLLRKEMSAHLQDNLVTHVSLLTASHKKIEQENQQLRDQLVQLEQKLETLSTNSVPNNVSFAITNFSQHKEDKDVWVSPPFYSHPRGYKMCLEVYANGNDDGESSHISVFVRMMRGEYDNILMWPFKGTLKLTLIGICNHKKSIMNFNHGNILLERVTEGTTSGGYGYTQWVPHSSLGQFLVNDTLYVNISEISVLLQK